MEAAPDYIAALMKAAPMTADELARLYVPGKQVQLVRGAPVVRELPSTRHGWIAGELSYRLASFVKERGLGVVFAQDTGFKIASDPDTVRGADVAFVARERTTQIPARGYAELAPDLVVEVVSPGDRPGEVLEKVGDWLNAGTRLIWVVDPDRRQVGAYRQDGSVSLLGPGEALGGDDVLPGFSCPVDELF